jgi:hypothetical protein
MIRSRNEFVLRACSRSLSSQQRSFPSQHGRVLPSQHPLPVTRAIAAQAEPSSQSLSIEIEAHNHQELRVSSTANTGIHIFRDRSWSVMSFSSRLACDPSRGPTCYPGGCAVPSHAL